MTEILEKKQSETEKTEIGKVIVQEVKEIEKDGEV